MQDAMHRSVNAACGVPIPQADLRSDNVVRRLLSQAHGVYFWTPPYLQNYTVFQKTDRYDYFDITSLIHKL